ncbi:MAG: hypothetical protein KJ755_19475 [Alphaproteobacteria bacterium]|nr:hypothetical protein [Alphaproteobacteria bacterium]
MGDNAAKNAAIKISEGFILGYCHAKPGCGPMMHNHDTNETFIANAGRIMQQCRQSSQSRH